MTERWTTRSLARLWAVEIARTQCDAMTMIADQLVAEEAARPLRTAYVLGLMQDKLVEMSVVVARVEGQSWSEIGPTIEMRPRAARRRYAAAERSFRRSVALAPLTDPTAATGIDRTLAEPDTAAAELRHWAEAMDVSPPLPWTDLGEQLHDQSHTGAELQRAIRERDVPEGTDLLHLRLHAQDHLVAFWERVIASYPDDPKVPAARVRLAAASAERASILRELETEVAPRPARRWRRRS